MEFFTTGIKKTNILQAHRLCCCRLRVREEVSSRDRLTCIFFVTVSQSLLNLLSLSCWQIERRRRCRKGQTDTDFFSSCSLSSLADNRHVTFWSPIIPLLHLQQTLAKPDVPACTHEPSTPVRLFILFQAFRGSEEQTSSSLPLLWPASDTAQPRISPVITSGVPSVQWNPTLPGRQRRDEVTYAVRRAQSLVVEALVCGATAADCTAVWLGHVLPPAGHTMPISCSKQS